MATEVIPMNEKGAILGQPGQYEKPPFLMLPGNPPLEEVTLYDFKVNEIPEPEDVNNIPEDYGKELVEVTEKKVKAYTYYCDLDADAEWDDSIFWDGNTHSESEKKACLDVRNKNGDGSEQNPWKNLTWAMEKIECVCSNLCCYYVRIICSGTAHYTICIYRNNTYSGFNGNNLFVVEKAQIKCFDLSEKKCFYNINGTYFSRCFANYEGLQLEGSNINRNSGFGECGNCVFDNCGSTIETNNISQAFYRVYGFVDCGGSKFYRCNVNVTGENKARAYGIYSCGGSIFYECNVNMNCTNYHFINAIESSDSKLYKCTVNLTGNYTENYYGDIGIYSMRGTVYECEVNDTITDSYKTNAFILTSGSGYRSKAILNGSGFYGSLFIGFDGVEVSLYNCNVSAEYEGNYIQGYLGSINGYNCTANLTSKEMEYSDVKGFVIGGMNLNLINCSCTCISNGVNAFSPRAYAYGFYNTSEDVILKNCSYSISAKAESIPLEDGYFSEEEYECGIYENSECKESYRCEIRTQEGTQSC